VLQALKGSFSNEAQAIFAASKLAASNVTKEIWLAKAQIDREEQVHQTAEREAAAQQRSSVSAFFARASKDIDESNENRKRIADRQQGRLLRPIDRHCN
jgi:hypothetical protein